MRVFNRKSVFRLGLSRVFARVSVVGLTGHSAIPQEFPYRGLAPTLARCLSPTQAVGLAVGYTSDVLPEPTARPTAQMNAANSRATAVMATTSSLPARAQRPIARGQPRLRLPGDVTHRAAAPPRAAPACRGRPAADGDSSRRIPPECCAPVGCRLLVIGPRRIRSPVECSDGTMPSQAISSRGVRNRVRSPISASNVVAA